MQIVKQMSIVNWANGSVHVCERGGVEEGNTLSYLPQLPCGGRQERRPNPRPSNTLHIRYGIQHMELSGFQKKHPANTVPEASLLHVQGTPVIATPFKCQQPTHLSPLH